MPTKKVADELDYSVLDMNMDEVGEPTVAPEGEHRMEVGKMAIELSKKGRPMVVIVGRFIDLEDTYPVREYLSYPQKGDEESVAKGFVRRFRRWARALGLDDDAIYGAGLDVLKAGGLTEETSPVVEPFETFQGLTFNAIVTVETLENGMEVNRINSVLIPQA